jgi:RNA-directed DNA polymerase
MTPSSLGNAATINDVAYFLGTSAHFLRYVLYGRKDRQRYIRFKIPKRRGGMRDISAPPESLKIMQRKIAAALLAIHPPKPSAHGFLRGRSVASNARRHESQRVVGNIDLENFFPSIHLGRIVKALEQPPYSLGKQAARVIAQICCDDPGRLPQGAPSSPILSNIVCRVLDEQLQQLARRHACRYTRYADDITISTSRPSLPVELFTSESLSKTIIVGAELNNAVTSCGFTINQSKVRIAHRERKQEVTGLTTNERVNIGRWYVRELDSLIHIWRCHGLERAVESYARRHRIPPDRATSARLLHFLRGKLSYLSMIKGEHDPVFRRIQWDLSDLAGSNLFNVSCLTKVAPASLRGMGGHFRGWQSMASRYAQSVLFLEIQAGEDLRSGSAFIVDAGVAITAGHNVHAGPVRVYIGEDSIVPSQILYVNTPGSLDFAILCFANTPFQGFEPFRFQYRLPEIGEPVSALGFPRVAQRHPDIVLHTGAVESLPTNFNKDVRFIQTSFHSGGGLSGAPLVDQRGFVLGLMVENVFMSADNVGNRSIGDAEEKLPIPARPYGQAIPFEYVARIRSLLQKGQNANDIQSPRLTVIESPIWV